MSAGAWVERGTGILRLNLTRDSDSDKSGARLGKSSFFLLHLKNSN